MTADEKHKVKMWLWDNYLRYYDEQDNISIPTMLYNFEKFLKTL